MGQLGLEVYSHIVPEQAMRKMQLLQAYYITAADVMNRGGSRASVM